MVGIITGMPLVPRSDVGMAADGIVIVGSAHDRAFVFNTPGPTRWVAPETGAYLIVAIGGGGAVGIDGRPGDAGDMIRGWVPMNAGDALEIEIGRAGRLPGEFGGHTSVVLVRNQEAD